MSNTPSSKKPIKEPVKPLSFVDDKLFQLADKHAAEALYLTAIGNACNVTEETDVTDELMRASRHFTKSAQEAYNALPDGDLLCAVTEAGIAFGLAMGLRLRGVR